MQFPLFVWAGLRIPGLLGYFLRQFPLDKRNLKHLLFPGIFNLSGWFIRQSEL